MLNLNGVTVRFGDKLAVNDVTLDIGEGERLSLLGPSGSGKSTLLRAIAGLEPLAAGRIEWDGRDLANVPVHRRGFGLMFQDYVLFPHLDVAGNVRFGIDKAGTRGGTAGAHRVAEVLDLVGLGGFEHRLPGQLSGGEQQRVALARALAPQPRLLMLDEPLGALDRGLRRSLLEELSALFERFDLPIVYVTHDHEEALAIGDRVAVMRDGRIEAVAPPRDLWLRPPSEFVARFLGLTNIVDAEVADGAVRTPIATLPLADADGRDRAADGPYRALIRPDAFRADPDGPIRARVRSVTFRGDHTLLRVDVPGDGEAGLGLDVQADWTPLPASGEALMLAVDPRGVVLLPRPQA